MGLFRVLYLSRPSNINLQVWFYKKKLICLANLPVNSPFLSRGKTNTAPLCCKFGHLTTQTDTQSLYYIRHDAVSVLWTP